MYDELKSGAGKCPKANKMAGKYLEAVWEIGTDNWDIGETIAKERRLREVKERRLALEKEEAELEADVSTRKLSGNFFPATDTQLDDEQ